MVFKVGETVVYPHHGAAVIEAIKTRVIKGEEKIYLVLKVAQGDLTVEVPSATPRSWAFATSSARMASTRSSRCCAPRTRRSRPTGPGATRPTSRSSPRGDVNKVAEVVRDLWRRDRERGLSAGEKRMLSKARQILVSELALAEGTNEDKAEVLLDEVLAS